MDNILVPNLLEIYYRNLKDHEGHAFMQTSYNSYVVHDTVSSHSLKSTTFHRKYWNCFPFCDLIITNWTGITDFRFIMDRNELKNGRETAHETKQLLYMPLESFQSRKTPNNSKQLLNK